MALRMFWLETLLNRASVEMQQRQFYCKLEPNANKIFLLTTMNAINLIRDLHTIFSSRKKNIEVIVFGSSDCSFQKLLIIKLIDCHRIKNENETRKLSEMHKFQHKNTNFCIHSGGCITTVEINLTDESFALKCGFPFMFLSSISISYTVFNESQSIRMPNTSF